MKVIESTGIVSAFIKVTGAALQSDLLVRLMRVLEWEERVGSFWLLYDRGLVKAGQDQIDRLKSLSKRLDFSAPSPMSLKIKSGRSFSAFDV